MTYAQSAGSCIVTAVPAQLRAEGLTERTGDIGLQCSGATPGTNLTGTLSVAMPVNVTNRVDANNQTLDAVLSVDYGSGFVPTGIPALVSNQFISFGNFSFTVPPSGKLNLKISNIRAAVSRLTTGDRVQAQLLLNSIPVNQSLVTVGFTQLGLLATLSNHGRITCAGSPVPSTLNLANLFATQTAFTSTRVTEGFAAAFQPRGQGDDTGTRFIVRYSGFPGNAHVYLPDLVAGSSALVPTAGGDLGVPQQIGQYVPGSGTLLLARVQFADANGAGGFAVPVPAGAGPVALNSVSEVSLANGAGYAVYEVIDANPTLQENAQFPAFIGISDVTAPAVAQETISFAPVSSVTAASTTAPVPRFSAIAPASDCGTLNDCGATYFPHLSVQASPITLAAVSGGAMTSTPGYIPIDNSGGGTMPWSAIVSYTNGSGWLTLDYTSGQNNGAVRTWANSKDLAAGTYRASVTIDAGGAGTATVPVTLTVQPAPVTPVPPTPPAPVVTVSKVLNPATFEVTPLVAGSIGTLMGSNLAGKSVSATFDDVPAVLLYTAATQINLQVPVSLGAKTSAQLVVTVDGVRSAPFPVALSPAWPSLFAGGVLNQDNSVNAPDRAAKAGDILQIFATGIPEGATVSAAIADRDNLVPLYAGAAPMLLGLQQVNVAIPSDVSGNAKLVVCATIGSRQYCSAGYPLAIQ